MRVALVSTHRSDRGHYAPLRRLLEADDRFDVSDIRAADVAVVLGDRYEMLQQAMRFVEVRVPILHIHGGEHTYGSLDERWRYAISAIADVHCTATEQASRVLTSRIGRAKVHVTGAPGLDGITDRQPWPYKVDVLVHYNPALDAETTKREWEAIVGAMMGLDVASYNIKPNGDRYSDLIDSPRFTELEPDRYRDLLAAAHVIVGNSSAGIIEAPSLGTWTVNVGERQAGRPRAASILDVEANVPLIRDTITLALGRPRAKYSNPYGDGHASERIRDVLLAMRK